MSKTTSLSPSRLNNIRNVVDKFEEKQRNDYINGIFSQEFSKDILEFVRKNKLILFGINPLSKDVPLNEAYYRILSDKAKRHGYELTNQLFLTQKYKFLEFKMDFDFSFVITSKGRKVAKFIQVSETEFKSLQDGNESKSPVLEVSEALFKASAYKAFSDPRYSLDRWNMYFLAMPKEPKRFEKVPIRPRLKQEYLDKIERILLRNEETIIIGAGAYEFLIYALEPEKLEGIERKDGFKGIGGIPEFVSWNVKGHLEELKKEFPDLKVKEERTALGGYFFPGKKFGVFIGEKNKLLDLYDGSGSCLPYVVFDRVAIGNIHVLLRFLYMGIILSFRLGDKVGVELRKRLKAIAGNLLWLLDKYGEGSQNQRQSILMKVFQYSPNETKGFQKNIERVFRIRKWEGKMGNEPLAIKGYKPEMEIQEGELKVED